MALPPSHSIEPTEACRSVIFPFIVERRLASAAHAFAKKSSPTNKEKHAKENRH
jgi:hypothetical protein